MAIEENTSDSTNPLLDLTNQLYMHPSENPGSMLVPVAFDGPGYRSWRRGCDNVATSWIWNSLSKDLADNLQYVNDAKELWQDLEDRYDQTNGAKLYQLQKEINNLSQGTLDITGYYTKMKKLWEKGSILMMNTLPSLAQAFVILIQEEKQREMKPNNQLMIDSSALSVNRAANNNFRTSYGQQGNKSGGSSYTNYNQSSGTWGNSFRGHYPTNRSRPVCNYCKKPGHTKDRCYNSSMVIHKTPSSIRENE
uniref:Retrotransposon Copia-like N-terminal domain-containing protein n=2 Tax=Nicotiana TaxID=4085 RepID=A0A1S4CX50_TOBAC|nr:PREDICTED: uncharacterized protein LOC104239346 [Nicotiana sylvestris]XP_016505706.1 PREDICTED: uncharacterized protein LOC107823541 [Nicotiana tabacum]